MAFTDSFFIIPNQSLLENIAKMRFHHPEYQLFMIDASFPMGSHAYSFLTDLENPHSSMLMMRVPLYSCCNSLQQKYPFA
jgi:hypothetical protein